MKFVQSLKLKKVFINLSTLNIRYCQSFMQFRAACVNPSINYGESGVFSLIKGVCSLTQAMVFYRFFIHLVPVQDPS